MLFVVSWFPSYSKKGIAFDREPRSNGVPIIWIQKWMNSQWKLCKKISAVLQQTHISLVFFSLSYSIYRDAIYYGIIMTRWTGGIRLAHRHHLSVEPPPPPPPLPLSILTVKHVDNFDSIYGPFICILFIIDFHAMLELNIRHLQMPYVDKSG